MGDVFDIDGVIGAFAMYQEPPTGPVDDPLYNPMAHLPRIIIHSALEYLQVAFEVSVTINHPFVARPANSWDWSTWSFNWYPVAYTVDRLLFTHNLGYEPFCILRSGGVIVEPGVPVQFNAGGGNRFMTLYVTATEVRARETVDTGNGDLPALNATYELLVLREPSRPDTDVMFDAETGRVRAGEGWFDSDYHYIRAVADGESPFNLVGSQNIDTAGGICRMVRAGNLLSHDFYDASKYTGGLTSIVSQAVQR